jgi:hypothetical protein
VKISEKEKLQFNTIDEILEIFQKNFINYSKEQILDVFHKNSFNMENSYLNLKDPKNFGSKNYNKFFFYFILFYIINPLIFFIFIYSFFLFFIYFIIFYRKYF